MTVWLIVLLAGALWLAASRPKIAAHAGRAAIGWGWLLVVGALAVLLLRFGMHWLVVAGGALIGVARALLPLVRFAPLLGGVAKFFSRSPTASFDQQPHSGGRARSESGPSRSSSARMSRQEALQVFGLTPEATPEDVRREYRRLMKRVHPDPGGSSYLAAKVNEARDVLL